MSKARANVRYAEQKAGSEEGEFSKPEVEIDVRSVTSLKELSETILADTQLGVNPKVLEEKLKASEVSNTSQNPSKLSNGRIIRTVETEDGIKLILDITLILTNVDWTFLD